MSEGTRQQAQGNSTLEYIRTAAVHAKEDRDECLRTLRSVIVKTQHVETMELFARLQGDIHEIDLLRKRELSLITDGREPENLTGGNGENGDRNQQGSKSPFPPLSPVPNLEGFEP